MKFWGGDSEKGWGEYDLELASPGFILHLALATLLEESRQPLDPQESQFYACEGRRDNNGSLQGPVQAGGEYLIHTKPPDNLSTEIDMHYVCVPFFNLLCFFKGKKMFSIF